MIRSVQEIETRTQGLMKEMEVLDLEMRRQMGQGEG